MERTEKISYSVCLENKQFQNNFKPTIGKKIYNWVNDESTQNCYNCKKIFMFYRRKHHCRLCGKIFCNDCSLKRTHIPESLLCGESKKIQWNEYLASYLISIDLTKYRVCDQCYNVIEKVNSVKKIIDVFKILKLDVLDLRRLGLVNKLWYYSASYCLGQFRDIQYKLPIEKLSDQEEDLLWQNIKYFSGHNKWLLNLLKACKNNEEIDRVENLILDKKTVNCWSLMCTRNCNTILNARDSITLLAYNFRTNNLRRKTEIALNFLNCSDREFKCYLPFLVYNLRYESVLIGDYLVQRCFKSLQLLNDLYWEIQHYDKEEHKKIYNDLYGKLKIVSTNEKYHKNFVRLLQSSATVRTLEELSEQIFEKSTDLSQLHKKFRFNSDSVVPTIPNVNIKSVNFEKIKIKNSANQPIIIPFIDENNSTHRIMFKRENLKKDQIIMNIITLVDIIVKKEEDLDLNIVNYTVLPTGENHGLIEIVENSETIYHISQVLDLSILNYILENNSDLKIGELRDRYIKSTAAYCVITYLLGVGDRHLDNIMVTKDGRLFHIDFGYILGKDPFFNNPGIRITPEIVEAIGGVKSIYYTQFKESCTRIYNCIRRNIDIFMNLIILLPKLTDIQLTEEEIRQQIIKRFIPSENYLDAELHLVNELEKRNYSYKFKDICHYHSREKTISSTLDKFSTAITSFWKTS